MAKQVRKQSNTRFVAVLVVIATVGVGVLGYSLSRPRAGVKPVDVNQIAASAAEGYPIALTTDAPPSVKVGSDEPEPVQVIEFGDFECPVCAQWTQVTEPDVRERLIKTRQIVFTFYDFPLDIHRNSWPAHNAVACAAEQGKFIAMHDRVFDTQDQWSDLMGVNDPVPGLQKAAQSVGADMTAWQSCFDSQKHYPRIKANLNEGLKRGIGQTPTFIIGDQMVPGRIPYDEFKKYVDQAAAKQAAAKKAGKAGAKAPSAKSGS